MWAETFAFAVIRLSKRGKLNLKQESSLFKIGFNKQSFHVVFVLFLLLPSLSRFVDSVAPFMLHDEQQEGVSTQEQRKLAPWKISEKEFEAFKLKVCVIIKLFPTCTT